MVGYQGCNFNKNMLQHLLSCEICEMFKNTEKNLLLHKVKVLSLPGRMQGAATAANEHPEMAHINFQS